MFSRGFLLEVRRRALRRGVWFSALDQVERGILSLTARVIDEVKSVVLGVELVKILVKLRDAMRSEFAVLVETAGLQRVRDIARRAVGWGCGAAVEWARDPGFARYHALLMFYSPSGWGL